MKQQKVKPKDVETRFSIEELFFSTTDRAGVIRSGNDVFVRLSKYPIDTLLESPHNIIRHPDMPRAVFKLLWDYLLDGRTIAAYVKNMSADGSYYWVFALVTPLPDGFLSIRLKPSSSFFEPVQQLYQQMRQIEIDNGDHGPEYKVGMELAAEHMFETLRSLGFESYDDFMYAALHEEMQSRNRLLAAGQNAQADSSEQPFKLPDDDTIDSAVMRQLQQRLETLFDHINEMYKQVDGFLALRDALSNKIRFVSDLTRQFRFTSLNTSLEAARLSENGACLGVIAAHLGESAEDLGLASSSFFDQIQKTMDGLKANIIRLATARLQVEVSLAFCNEATGAACATTSSVFKAHTSGERQSLTGALTDLRSALASTLDEIGPSLTSLLRELTLLNSLAETLRRSTLALRLSQLGGQIEAAHLTTATSATALLQEVESRIEAAREQFDELSELISDVSMTLKRSPSRMRFITSNLGSEQDWSIQEAA